MTRPAMTHPLHAYLLDKHKRKQTERMRMQAHAQVAIDVAREHSLIAHETPAAVTVHCPNRQHDAHRQGDTLPTAFINPDTNMVTCFKCGQYSAKKFCAMLSLSDREFTDRVNKAVHRLKLWRNT